MQRAKGSCPPQSRAAVYFYFRTLPNLRRYLRKPVVRQLSLAKFMAMHLRARILQDVDSIADQQLLHQLFDYVQVLKRTPQQAASNRESVLRFAGTLDDTEAASLSQMLSQEFGQVEEEW